jgi:hypothetical protein
MAIVSMIHVGRREAKERRQRRNVRRGTVVPADRQARRLERPLCARVAGLGTCVYLVTKRRMHRLPVSSPPISKLYTQADVPCMYKMTRSFSTS